MKFLVAISALAACTIFASARQTQLDFSRVPAEAKREFQAVIAEKISDLFMQKLVSNHSKAAPRDPVLPPLPDSVEIENAELELGELGVDGISGFVALRNGWATGLNTLIDDLTLNLIAFPARITYDVKVTELAVEGAYEAIEVLIDEISASGSGELAVAISNLHALIDLRVIVNLITGRLTFQTVTISVDFTSVNLNLEDLEVCDDPVDWDLVNEDAKPVFDQFWAENKGEVEALVKDILQEVLKDCNIYEVIGGDISCLPFDIGNAKKISKSSNPFRSAFNYFAPIMPRLTCDDLSDTPDTPPPGEQTTTTTNPITTTTDLPTTTTAPPTTTTAPPTTTAGASHGQAGAGILFAILLMLGARVV